MADSVRASFMLDQYKKHMELALKLEREGMNLPGSRIAIVEDEAPDVTRGGIVLPDTAMKGKPANGTIVRLGSAYDPEEELDESMLETFAVGDRVAFSKYGGSEIQLYLDGPDEEPAVVHVMRLSDVYFYWNPRKGTELD